jgi:hypothetical protein
MSEKTLDPNAEIDGTDDMGGFELPRLGNIKEGTGVLMEFTGEIPNCGENDLSLGFELAEADDPSKKAKIFCKTTTNQGLSRIVGIGKDSGVFKKINDKRVAAGKKSILSETGTVKTKILQDKKFHEQLRAEIAGCKILCTITHSPAKPYEDKESGEMKEGFPQANIGKIAASDAKQGTANATTTAAANSDVAPESDDGFGD